MSYNYTQGGPTAPMGGTPEPAIGQAGLMDVVNSWITSVTKPAVSTYAAEVPRAAQNRLIMSVGLATVVAAVAGLLGGVLRGNAVGGFLGSLITTPIFFLLTVGAFFLGAQLMKGSANFLQFAWVISTIWAPISILRSVLGIFSGVPLLNLIAGLIGLLALIYSFYLYYLSIQAVQRLDGSNAIISILIGVVIWVVGAVVIGTIVGILGFGASLLAG